MPLRIGASVSNVRGWTGAALGIAGVVILSTNTVMSPWSFPFFVAGNIAWILQGVHSDNRPVLVQNTALLIINAFGLVRWLF